MTAETQQTRKRNFWLLIALGAILLEAIIIAIVIRETAQPNWKVEWLRDPNPAVRAHAIRTFPRGGDFQLVVNAIQDEDPDVRLLAAEQLGWNHTEILIDLLNDDNLSVRRQAAWSLSYIGPKSWPTLRSALQNENARMRAGAALSLRDAFWNKGEYRAWPLKEKDAIVPILRKLLNDEDQEVRRNVERALEEIDDRERKDRP